MRLYCELCPQMEGGFEDAAQSRFYRTEGGFEFYMCGKHAIFLRKLLVELKAGFLEELLQ